MLTAAPSERRTDRAPQIMLSHLAKQARHAGSLVDLGFVLVHETRLLLPYGQAALWLQQEGITALSGGVNPQRMGSCVQWLKRWCQSHPAEAEPLAWDLRQAARGDDEWRGCLSPWLIAVPLRQPDAPSGPALGTLLLAREAPCTPQELALLQQWTQTWADCHLTRLSRQRAWRWPDWKAGLTRWRWKTQTVVMAALGLLGLYAGERLVVAQQASSARELALVAPSPADVQPETRNKEAAAGWVVSAR